MKSERTLLTWWASGNLDPDTFEAFEERAGIAEFMGGLTRGEAELVALCCALKLPIEQLGDVRRFVTEAGLA